MSHERSSPRLVRPRSVRAARAALLTGRAASLLEQIRPVLCEPTRTHIVRALSTGPLTVGDLAAAIDRGRTATSQHLRVLRDENIVVPRRRGRRVYYALTAEAAARAALRSLDLLAEAAG